MKIEEGVRVRTLVEKEGYKTGTLGAVVHIWKGGPECEVEIWDNTLYPIDVVTYKFDEVEVVDVTQY